MSSTQLLLIVVVLTREAFILCAGLAFLAGGGFDFLLGQLAKFPGLVFSVGILMAIVVDMMIYVDGMWAIG